MNIDKFHNLSSKLSSTTFSVNSINLSARIDEKGKTDAMNLLEGNYGKLNFPIVFKHVSGKKHCDLIGSGWGILYLISDRMKELLEKYNLTGWKCFPVEILDKKGEKIQEVYHGLSIVGRSGPIDYGKSFLIEKRTIPNGPLSKYYKGLYFEMETWDGSDFFLVKNNWGTMVTKKAKDLLVEHKLTNLMFYNLAEMEVNTSTIIEKDKKY